MFDDIVVAAQFRAFHAAARDDLLDEAARRAGCPSGIGRLCLLSDAMLPEILSRLKLRNGSRLLDIGCGRGFLERVLERERYSVHTLGIDRSRDAIAAARRHCTSAEFVEADYRTYPLRREFDAIAALELAPSGNLTETLVSATRSALVEGGRFCITAASLDGRHDTRLDAARASLRDRFTNVEIVDATRDAAAFAESLYEACSRIDGWTPEIRLRIAQQADAVLHSIQRGDFNYALVFGRG